MLEEEPGPGGVLAICQEEAKLEEQWCADFYGTECNCTKMEDGLTVLSCTDTACTYCNNLGKMCLISLFGEIYNNDGSYLAFFETFVYVSGQDDTVTLVDGSVHY
jgi:hypothetical protein